jgi:hypothetical protein
MNWGAVCCSVQVGGQIKIDHLRLAREDGRRHPRHRVMRVPLRSVAVRVLVTVPSLPPRRTGGAASARLRRSLLPSRGHDTLGLRSLAFSRLPLRSLTLRPGTLLTILPMASSMGSRGSVSLRPAIQATGRLALVPVGLPPTEHVCLWIAPCPSPKLHPVGKWLIDQL